MTRLLLLLLTTSISITLFSQSEKLVVEGAIVIDDNEDPNPVAGTIKWDGNDFLGFDGSVWKSLTCCGDDNVVDCDGNTYDTIQICNQTWLSSNLKATCYNDGTPIQWISDFPTWQSVQNGTIVDVGAHSGYNEANEAQFGNLYNYYVASSALNGGPNVCPVGYHVPTDQEWKDLISCIDPPSSGSNFNVAGGHLKTISPPGLWAPPNTGASNTYQWDGNPGFEVNGMFNGQTVVYWSTDLTASGVNALARRMAYDEANLRTQSNNLSGGLYIRCIKD